MSADLSPQEEAGLDPTVRNMMLGVPKIPVPTDNKYTAKELADLLQAGIQLHMKGETRAAMEHYREVLLYDRGNKRALYYTAIALSQQNQDEKQVLAIMEHAVKEAGNVPEAHYNLGILLHRMGELDKAAVRFERALELMPALVEARTSLAGCFLNRGDLAQGIATLQRAARTDTTGVDSLYSRAFARLTLGDLYGGLTDYDVRWKTSSFLVENKRNFGGARYWTGKPIPGKTLYIHTEQGAGDVIMMSRFLPMIRARSQAACVVLEVGESLVSLLTGIDGVDHVIASNTPVPEGVARINYYLPMMGMMRVLGIFDYAKVPCAGGWLLPGGVAPTLEAILEPDISAAPRPRVGIAWAGSKAHKNDRYRSIPWAVFRDALLPHLKDWDVYSFQVGERARDIDDNPTGVPIIDLTPELKTFNDTAAALHKMDLLIAVDTATVHAAGALMGGPDIFLLTPAAPDWRWLLTEQWTPWYQRVTLFRQTRYDDWAGPFEHVVKYTHAARDRHEAAIADGAF
jgi:Tfp pilus assembly protein PilF